MAKKYEIGSATDYNLRAQIAQALNEMMQLDSGNGGTGWPDGQVMTGNQYLHDTLAQDSNYIWVQDEDVSDVGGFIVIDFDPSLGQPPTEQDVTAFFGLGESIKQPGTKGVGVVFENPTYQAVVTTAYEGSVRFQALNIPYNPTTPVEWTWPTTDGPAGATLTSNGSGGLYWTDPATPPSEITDTDTTDVLIDEVPAWTTIPVTVTATQSSIPAQVSLDISYWSNNNNQTLYTRMLIDGTPSGTVFTTPLPRNSIVDEHFTWSPTLPNGNEVITVEVQKVGGQACWIYGATGEPAVLTLLEPGGVLAFSARSGGTDYIIGPTEFWDRFLDSEKEAMVMKANRAPPGPLMPWLDVFNLTAFMTLYMTNNINLLLPDTIAHVNQLETWGIIGPGRAAVILAT